MSNISVYVDKSRIEEAGRGVFVKANVRKGMWLCYYHGYIKSAKESLLPEEQEYGIEYGEKTIIGTSEEGEDGGVAQIINDGACPKFNFSCKGLNLRERVRLVCKELLNYCKDSLAKENVFSSDSINFYALRNLRAGEECFFFYGPDYWCYRICNSTEDVYLFSALCYVSNYLRWQAERNRNNPLLELSKLLELKDDVFLPSRFRKANVNLETIDAKMLKLADDIITGKRQGEFIYF